MSNVLRVAGAKGSVILRTLMESPEAAKRSLSSLDSTNFEYLNNFNLGVGNSNYYERIDTDSTASVKQKAQKGNYWDSFLNLSFDFDTRNQKFQATEGFRSQYFIDLPLISETATLQNTYIYKYFTMPPMPKLSILNVTVYGGCRTAGIIILKADFEQS